MGPPLSNATRTVIALLACHDRRQLTLACLESLFAQELPPGIRLEAVLVDDGSSDGTGAAVLERWGEVGPTVIEGDGSLYWAGAMSVAEAEAWGRKPDYLFWLNDDVVLDAGAIGRLLEVSESAQGDAPAIAVGPMRHPRSGELTYSGVRPSGRHPIRIELIEPRDPPQRVPMFHGNAVLIPRRVVERIGFIDAKLIHTSADFDYGLRAEAAGMAALLAPETVGTCPEGPFSEQWLEAEMPARERLRFFFGPKGYPPRTRARWLRRHGGWAWPIWWLAPYVRSPFRLAFRALSGQRRR